MAALLRWVWLIAFASALLPAMQVAAEMDHSAHDAESMESHGAHVGAAAHIHHQHPENAWMFDYRFMQMRMDGLLNGTGNVDSRAISGVLPGMPPTQDPAKPYRMAPTEMTMDMHMLMVMYGWTSRVTLMGMAMYRENEMDMVMHMPTMDMSGTMKTDGLGDSLLGVMINSSDRVTSSLSMPTGDIDKRVDMTMRSAAMSLTNNVKAGYPMQLGSGTWDLIPAITYALAGERIGVGFQGSYTWRIGDNDQGYTLGDVIEITTWAKRAINKYLLGTLTATYGRWGRIEGQDRELNPAMAPTTDPRATGGSRIDAGLALNGFFGNRHSAGVELRVPLYQDLNGPQMETEWILSLTYQYMR
jgi:hypothetical protein